MTIQCDITGERYVFLQDGTGNVQMPDGYYKPWNELWLDIIRVNYYAGYVVFKDGTIKCALEANAYVEQYDGALEAEINEMFNEPTFK